MRNLLKKGMQGKVNRIKTTFKIVFKTVFLDINNVKNFQFFVELFNFLKLKSKDFLKISQLGDFLTIKIVIYFLWCMT